MSLIRKQSITQKNRRSKRANGVKSRGPVTPAGKANRAAARLLHGFYSQSRDEVLTALGEDPKEYNRLLQSLVEDLQPTEGLGGELVLRMRRVLWRMRRAERIQDGLALQHVQSELRKQEMKAGPKLLLIHGLYEQLVGMGTKLSGPDCVLSLDEIRAFESGFGPEPPEGIQILFPLLRSFQAAAGDVEQPANPQPASEPNIGPGKESEKQAAFTVLRSAMHQTVFHYRRILDMLLEESNALRSPENIAALMAPQDGNAWLMQRMEDSGIRQLWRLTKLFLTLKRSPVQAGADPNLAESDYVDENADS